MATGTIPEEKKDADRGEKKALKKHAGGWFDSVECGRELAAKVFKSGLWPQLKGQILPFLNSIRGAVSLPTSSSCRDERSSCCRRPEFGCAVGCRGSVTRLRPFAGRRGVSNDEFSIEDQSHP